MRRSAAGFTLVEIVVAVAIFAVIGAMAFGGLNNLMTRRDQADTAATRSRDIQATLLRMTQDFEELDSRPTREPLGTNYEDALNVARQSTTDFVLIRAGWSNPAGVPRPTLQRVRYHIDDNKLMRDYWVVLDRTPDLKPVSVTMLNNVTSLHLRYLDTTGAWHSDEWPPQGYNPLQAPCLRPKAVEITLETKDWGKITRLIEVPG